MVRATQADGSVVLSFVIAAGPPNQVSLIAAGEVQLRRRQFIT